jgi:type II secretory pathway component PulJ
VSSCRLLQAINKLAEAMQVLGLRHAPNRQQHQQQQALVSSQQQQQAAYTAADSAANGTQQQQQQDPQQQPVCWAIDIGACPGGWTSYLADSCCYNVLAVDPAPMHPDVTARPRVRQILGRAQEVGQQVDEALAGQQVGAETACCCAFWCSCCVLWLV